MHSLRKSKEGLGVCDVNRSVCQPALIFDTLFIKEIVKPSPG